MLKCIVYIKLPILQIRKNILVQVLDPKSVGKNILIMLITQIHRHIIIHYNALFENTELKILILKF
jgi:hypothetical protein